MKKDIKIKKTKTQKKLNKLLKSHKIQYLYGIRISILLCFFFFAWFYVGNHSDYLMKDYLKIASLVISILSLICFIIFMVLYLTREKDYIMPKRAFWINSATVFVCSSAIAVLTLLYGSNASFRDWLITTAMGTMNHQYLCKIFYNQSEIDESLSHNYLIESDQIYDEGLIEVVSNDKDKEFTYDENNEFEVKMFKDHTDDEIYRLLRFEVNGQKAFLAIVYDPANITVEMSKYAYNSGEYIVDMARRTNALLAVNGGRFVDPFWTSAGGDPEGATLSHGKIYSDHPYGAPLGAICLSEDNKLGLFRSKSALELKDLGMRDCVTSQPFLIVNGEAAYIKGNGGYGLDARTAIGQRPDGVTIIVVVESNETRTNGAGMRDLTEIFINYGCYNAATLDGGTSTVMVENGVMISRPVNGSFKFITRPVATGIIIKDMKKEA